MLKVSKVNLRWEDIQMAEIALDKLVLHFSQCNKAEGKSPKTVVWHSQMLTSFITFLKTTGLGQTLADLTPANVRGFILYEQQQKSWLKFCRHLKTAGYLVAISFCLAGFIELANHLLVAN